MAKARIRIGDLAGAGLPAEAGSIILVAASGMGGKMTYRTAPPTTITNGGTQKDRGIETGASVRSLAGRGTGKGAHRVALVLGRRRPSMRGNL